MRPLEVAGGPFAMNKTRNLIAAAAFAALALSPALAAPETYKIDPAHSQANFSIRHNMVSRVQGGFKSVGGEITVDKENWSASKVKAEIDATTINTGNDKRDAHLKSDDFFKTEKNPKITFESTSVTSSGPDKLTVNGNLTMAGVTKPVTLDVTVGGFSAGLAGFEAKTKINRKDFGIIWNHALDAGRRRPRRDRGHHYHGRGQDTAEGSSKADDKKPPAATREEVASLDGGRACLAPHRGRRGAALASRRPAPALRSCARFLTLDADAQREDRGRALRTR
jgi:polyisoprenoid-binding protein YceI